MIHPTRLVWTVATSVLAVCWMPGCGSNTTGFNPSFPLTVDDARDELQAMATDPRPLARPVFVIGGYLQPWFSSNDTARGLRPGVTNGEYVHVISMFSRRTMASCRAYARRRIAEWLVEHDLPADTPVDVIGISMGGLVARDAATDQGVTDTSPRVEIEHLFTIGTPHLGAARARLPLPDSKVTAMRAGSEHLARLDAAPRTYSLIPYVRLGDVTVGAVNAAPVDIPAWWVPTIPFTLPHGDAHHDPRILADMLRRLRGEAPFTTEPAAPLPPGA